MKTHRATTIHPSLAAAINPYRPDHDLAPRPHVGLDVAGPREMAEHRSGWSRRFDEPIAAPNGSALVSLRDAANYITAFPDEEACGVGPVT